MTGIQSRSIPSRAMSSVLMARRRTDVKATSNVSPASFISRPASRASASPLSDRSTSVQPVNRFSLFHSLSPWRSSTTLDMELSQGRLPGVLRGAAERLLDAQELVVLGDPIGPARGAGLDLSRARRDGEVGDRRILGLA